MSVKVSINDDIEECEVAGNWLSIKRLFPNSKSIQSLDVTWSQMFIIQAASTSSGLVSFGKLTLAFLCPRLSVIISVNK